jgi:glycosyltransferase involved in cell wall biosynthesis
MQNLAVRGVRIMAMVHDLIPITHPEYCSPAAGPWHQQRIEQLLEYAELIITNSQSTANELREFARTIQLTTPRLCAAPLGVESAFLEAPLIPPAAGPYFVCVGTLEPRKNLHLLFNIWRRLAERLGDDTPPLVLAGQRGWETESIIDHLDRSPAVRRHVHEASGLNDAELAGLIAGATALLSPSYTEGFNLPIAEAFALGTPVIASDIPVHRELASGAHLIDPLDGPAWLTAIESAIRTRPATNMTALPSWAAHFALVAKAIGLQE